MQTYKNHSLLRLNTFGIDQRCDELWVYENEADAVAIARGGELAHRPYLLLGGGSNLLLTQDFHGVVVTPQKRFSVKLTELSAGEVELRCWAGTTFDDVVAFAVEHGCYGMENLSLIPGECGASAVQNIGAYGAEAKDFIVSVDAVELATARPVTILATDCQYGYRESRFKHEWKGKYLITAVTYRLSRHFRPRLDYGNIRAELQRRGISEHELTAQQLRDVIIDIRRAKLPDPAVTGNAGSFFMNPIVDEETFKKLKAGHPDLHYFEVPDNEVPVNLKSHASSLTSQPSSLKYYKIPAGWMIDRCGWKGKSLGRAGVHDKQALVLVNRGGAEGVDIVNLMHAIQKDVKSKFGLELHPEVNVI